jgi:hypothetical protein
VNGSGGKVNSVRQRGEELPRNFEYSECVESISLSVCVKIRLECASNTSYV